MADLVCDTNVFYALAAGRVDIARVRAAGHRLLLTPVTVLELVSHVGEQNFARRRAAAQAAIAHADETLPDPEAWLARIWNIEAEPPGVDWRGGLQALAQAHDLASLGAGVADPDAGVVRRVDVDLARGWRGGHYEDFEAGVIQALDDRVPGYGAARAASRVQHLRQAEGARLAQDLHGPAAQTAFLFATRMRAELGAVGPVGAPAQGEVARAAAELGPYTSAYAEYLVRAATVFAPEPNDFGDLECFLYLSGGRLLATCERRWLDIAAALGLAGQAVDPTRL